MERLAAAGYTAQTLINRLPTKRSKTSYFVWCCHQVDHLPERELEVHLPEQNQPAQVAPSLGGRGHAES